MRKLEVVHPVRYIIREIVRELRGKRGITIYASAKAWGMRQESIKRIESCVLDGKIFGSADSICKYIDNFAASYPSSFRRILMELCNKVGQTYI